MRKVLLLWLVLLSVDGTAQRLTKGTEFWTGFMHNNAGPWEALYLQISAERATEVTIAIPLESYSQTYSVAANSTVRVSVPPELAISPLDNGPDNTGILITAADSISVMMLATTPFLSDAAQVLPTSLLGTDYRIVTPVGYSIPSSGARFKSQFTIVATADNTEVSIRPTGGKAPQTVQLRAGQAYQVASMDDLSGTRIVSNDPCRPVAVLSGCMVGRVNIPGATCQSGDYMLEQMPPLPTWGTRFLVAPFINPFGRLPYYALKVVASGNGTTILRNGNPLTTLNAGETYYEEGLSQPVLLEANYPVLVAQLMTGGACMNGGNPAQAGDPSMLLVPPVTHVVSSSLLGCFSTAEIKAHYVNVILRTTDTARLYVDQNRYQGRYQLFEADTAYCFTTLPLAEGSHALRNSGGFLASAYGYGTSDSYAYPLTQALKPFGAISFATLLCTQSPSTFQFTQGSEAYYTPIRWLFGDGQESTDSQPIHAYGNPGRYLVQLVVNSGCGRTDTLAQTVDVQPRPDAQVQPSRRRICPGDTVQLSATGGIRYTWSPPEGLNNPNSASPVAAPAQTTRYTVTAENEAGCADTSSVLIEVENIQLDISPASAQGYVPLTVRFANHSTQATSFRWHLPDGISEEKSPTVVFNAPGIYEINVEGIGKNGCVASETIRVEAIQLFVPNVITPNGDADNEYFQPALLGEWSLEIYNRWGKAVFAQSPYEGKFNGVSLPTGTYFYLLRNEQGTVLKGTLNILR